MKKEFYYTLSASLAIMSGCQMDRGHNDPPNVILIMADDLGYQELGCYGQEIIKTPNIDRLAEDGIRFLNHYSGSPVCAPSRCVLLTGKHSGHSYIRDNSEVGDWYDYLGQISIPDSVFTLGEMMKAQGYTTAAIGKWGLGGPGFEGSNHAPGHPNNQGFDLFYGYLCQRQAHNYYPEYLWRNGEKDSLNNIFFKPSQRFEGDPQNLEDFNKYKGQDYAADKMIEEALTFIKENQDTSFFLYFPTPVPHLALQVPDDELIPYRENTPDSAYLGENGYLPHPYPRAAYAGMITRMDRQIGQMMELLKELGLEENTIVMFTSDNGASWVGGVDTDYFGSHGPFRGRKATLYEGGIRVPLIVKWPGKIDPGRATEHISAFWDILPTLAEITGYTREMRVDGLSLLPTLLGRDGQLDHNYLYWEYFGGQGSQAVRQGIWKGLRLGGETDPDPHLALYNLEEDIGESTDISMEHPDLVREMKSIMDRRVPSNIERWNFSTDKNH